MSRLSTAKSTKSPVVVRIERLRELSGKTWDQIAGELAVNRSMLFHVLSGKRHFSPKVLKRLTDCEVAAGIKSRASVLIESGLKAQDLVAILLNDESASSQVTAQDIDAGATEVEVEFRGTPPQDCKSPVLVKAPGNAAVWRIMGEGGAANDPYRFLAACLPEPYSNAAILDKLKPQSYQRLWETALDLTFGLGWRKNIRLGD
jgi:transcriptional regulator with XRE-family HTH domain